MSSWLLTQLPWQVLDSIHVATCLHRLACIAKQPGAPKGPDAGQLHERPDYLLLLELAAINAHKFTAQGLGNVLWALAILGRPSRHALLFLVCISQSG